MEQGEGSPPQGSDAHSDDGDNGRLLHEVQDADLKLQVATLRQETNEWTKKAHELEADNTRLKEQLKRISGGTSVEEMESLDDLKRKKAQAEASVSEMQVRLDAMAARNKAMEIELSGVLERNKQLSDENCKYLNDSVTQAKLSQRLAGERDELRTTQAGLQAQLATVTQSADQLKTANKRLQADLASIEDRTTTRIAELTAELEVAKSEADALRGAMTEKEAKLRQAVADVEAQEDGRAQELEGMRDEVAALTAKNEALDSAREGLAMAVDRKTVEVEQLYADNERLSQCYAETQERLGECETAAREEMDRLSDARNVAESEVVRLRNQLNAIHPLLKVPDPDADPASDPDAKAIPMPFTLSEIAAAMEELATTKAQLATLQAAHKELSEDRSTSARAVQNERIRQEHLAAQVVELKYTIDTLSREKAEAEAFRDKNKAMLEEADGAAKMNEILSTQLQYMLHQQGGEPADTRDEDMVDLPMIDPVPLPSLATPLSSAGRPSVGGGALQVYGAASASVPRAKQPIEFSSVQEVQQQNARLHVALQSAEARREEDVEEARAAIEAKCKAALDELKHEHEAVCADRDRLHDELEAAAAKCQRLAETVEACSKYDRALSVTSPSRPVGIAGTPSARKGAPSGPSLPASAMAKQKELMEDLKMAREEVESIKAECLEARRQCDTVDARRLHVEALHESALDTMRHTELERDHYKAQLKVSEETSEKMMKHVMGGQDQLREFKVRAAQAEGKLELVEEEMKKLYEINNALMNSQSSVDDVIVQVSGVKSFLSEHKNMKESEMKMERDEARQVLAKKEQELQEVNQALREHCSKHDKELTDLRADLVTAREQLATANKMLAEERRNHRQQIMQNQRLGEEMERYESERKLLKQTDAVEDVNYLAPAAAGAEELKKKIAQLEIDLAAKEKTAACHKKANAALEEYWKDAAAKLQKDAAANEALKGELEQLRQVERARKEEWERTTQELAAREQAVKDREVSQKAEMEALREQCAGLQKTLDDGEHGRVDADQRCRRAEENAETLRTRYEGAQIEIADLTQENTVLKTTAERARPSLGSPPPLPMSPGREAEVREINATLKTELDAAHALLAHIEPAKEIREKDVTAYMDALRGRNKGLEQDLRNAQLEVRVGEAKIEQLRRQVQAAAPLGSTDALAKMERRVQNLKDELQQQAKEAQRLCADLDAARAERDELAGKLNAAPKLKEELRQRARFTEEAQVKIQRLEKQVQTLEESAAEQRRELETKTAELTKQLLVELELRKKHQGEKRKTQEELDRAREQLAAAVAAQGEGGAPPVQAEQPMGGKRSHSALTPETTEGQKIRRTETLSFASSSAVATPAEPAPAVNPFNPFGTTTPEPPAVATSTSPSPDPTTQAARKTARKW